jgi:hypothetical protein
MPAHAGGSATHRVFRHKPVQLARSHHLWYSRIARRGMLPRKRQEAQPGRRIVSEGTLRRHAQSSNSAIFRSRVVKASPRDLLFVSSNTVPLSSRARTMNPCPGSMAISIRPRFLTQQDVVFLASRTDPQVSRLSPTAAHLELLPASARARLIATRAIGSRATRNGSGLTSRLRIGNV